MRQVAAPRGLPPNRIGEFARTRLSSDLRRVGAGGCVDVLVAGGQTKSRRAPFPGHECRPRGLPDSGVPRPAWPGTRTCWTRTVT